MIRFYLGLWAAKFLMFIYKIIGNEKDDKPGLLAYRFCNNFIEKIKKPKFIVCVTGTNGKSTVSNVVADIFKLTGKKVSYNDWGANTLAGHTRCLLDTVNIFNKSIKEVAVLEVDEKTSPNTIPYIKPNYIIVTNICRDSIRRNAHPYYIFDQIKKAVESVPNCKLILNADDPISSFLRDDNCIYYSVNKYNDTENKYNANDFTVCPKCYSKVKYDYNHYRHIGKVHCTKCDFKSKNGDYIVTNINYKKKEIVVEAKNKKTTYPLLSSTIFNVYNTLSVIAFFKEIGYKSEKIKECLSKVSVPKSREAEEVVKNVHLCNQMCKGQNVSASSTVFEYLQHQPYDMELVLLMNEVYGKVKATETITWFYETDYEFLNKPNIKKFIVGGDRYLDYKLRLLLAGIDEDKIICIPDEKDVAKYVSLKGIDHVYFLYESDAISKSFAVKDEVKRRLLAGDKNEN